MPNHGGDNLAAFDARLNLASVELIIEDVEGPWQIYHREMPLVRKRKHRRVDRFHQRVDLLYGVAWSWHCGHGAINTIVSIHVPRWPVLEHQNHVRGDPQTSINNLRITWWELFNNFRQAVHPV